MYPFEAFNKALFSWYGQLSQTSIELLTENKTIGVSEKDIIYKDEYATLFHYHALAPKQVKTPLLVCFALVNKPYMMDLTEDTSLIRELLNQGQDVYLIYWHTPKRYDKALTLDRYINFHLKQCVNAVKHHSKQKRINLLGVCQGGVFTLCYSALYPADIKNLITMVTPVDFQTEDNLLGKLMHAIDIDLMVDTLGNIPGLWLTQLFMSLKPFILLGKKYINMLDKLGDSKTMQRFFAMEKWIFDNPDQAGEAFRKFIHQCYEQNNLIKGELRIGRNKIKLSKITMPVLNLVATRDHLVPPDASRALEKYVASNDYHYKEFASGHIGIYISDRTRKLVADTIHCWLQAHT